MKCTPININGMNGFVCSRSRARTKPCSEPSCGRAGTRACDYPLAGRKSGRSCDRAICDAHSHQHGTHQDGPYKGDRIDYCPAHHERAENLACAAAQRAPEEAADAPYVAPATQSSFDFGGPPACADCGEVKPHA
jgi:hypothetical protein